MKTKIITWFSIALASSAIMLSTVSADTSSVCTETNRETIKVILDKQKAWETISDAEKATLESVKECFMRNRTWDTHSWSGRQMPQMTQLTDEEKTQLESMTDAEKKAFFESKFWTWFLDNRHTDDMRQFWSGALNNNKFNDKDNLKKKLSTAHQNAADGLFKKYVDKIWSQDTETQIASIDKMLTKIDSALTKVNNWNYSTTTKEKYTNLFNYLKLSFEEQKAQLNWDTTTDDADLNSIFEE